MCASHGTFMKKTSSLLKTVSILYIIFGAVVLCYAIVSPIYGLMVSKKAAAGFDIFLLILTFCLAAIMLSAGIIGLKSKSFKLRNTMAVLILTLSIISLIFALSAGIVTWLSFANLVLPVLYFMGVRKSDVDSEE